MNINTTTSIFTSARKAIENDVKQTIQDVDSLIHGGVAHIEAEAKTGEANVAAAVKADTSRIIHELHVTTVAAGKDITVKFDHAAGEVKRIVINGVTTVEGLLTHLRGLM